MLKLKLEGERLLSYWQGQMLRQCCSTPGRRKKPGESEPFTPRICGFSRLLYRNLPLDAVVACPSFHLTFVIFEAKHDRDLPTPSHCPPQLSPFHGPPGDHRPLETITTFGRVSKTSCTLFPSSLCSEYLECASRNFRLAFSL